MGVSVEQWRAAIGTYNARNSCSLARSSFSSQFLFLLVLCFVTAALLEATMTAMMLLILLSGDVERNPGPYNMGKLPWFEYSPSDIKLGLETTVSKRGAGR